MSIKLLSPALIAALLAACSETVSAPAEAIRQPPSEPLPTVALARESIARETRFDGVVEALSRSTVAAQTGGRVMDLPFDVGDQVPPGAAIVRLTSKEQGSQVDAAESAVAEARARQAEARQNHQRAQDLYARQLIAKAEFDRIAADLRAAQARQDAAQARLEHAREALNYTVVRAPYGGLVLARHVQLGETVAPGTPLMTGLSLDQLRIVVAVPQQQIGPLRQHRKARILLPDGSQITTTALRIPPAADPATHSFAVRIDLPGGDFELFPGTLVKVAFVSGEDSALLLPASALVRRGELTGAYVLDQAGLLSLRYVRVGSPLADGRLPVAAGLVDGERVVSDPIAAALAYKQQYAGPSGHE